MTRPLRPLAVAALALAWLAPSTRAEDDPAPFPEPRPGERLERRGDEIVVCGQLVHTTAPVVLWLDPGGYDAYRVERRFVPADQAGWEASRAAGLRTPVRFGLRRHDLSRAQVEEVRRGGWTLDRLRDVVDQFVIHYDAAGTSRRCFEILHDRRGLSVHFMIDLDGTIYQTLDLKEAAWHATVANGRSIGVEIANLGAFPRADGGGPVPGPLATAYVRDATGHTGLVPPPAERDALRRPDAALRPIRDELIVGTVQGQELAQYDLTPEQYDSLIRLTATLAALFPKIRLDYPRDESGRLIPHKLPDDRLRSYQGLLGHYHVQTNKVDPGPAFQWDRVIDGARALIAEPGGGEEASR